MRILICICVLSGGLAAQSPAKATTPPPPARQTRKIAPMTIPKDAVETKPGFFQWTDKTGKSWTYRRTPFGVARWPTDSEEIKQSALDKQKAVGTRTTAVEVGDSVRFEQATPFGKRTWVRKKSELDETEQRIWAQHQKTSTADRTAEKE